MASSYVRPTSLDEALASLKAATAAGAPRRPVILAGGTDYYPARVGRALDDDILDITAIPDLKGISETAEHWRIGATTTWGEIVAADLPPHFDGLKQAARVVGGAQIQNAGTIAGNLCNASPAADGAPMLMAMRARVEIRNAAGRREMQLSEFITGNRRTALQPGELVTGLIVPKPKKPSCSVFLKLGAREYLVISIAMAGLVLEVEDGVIAGAGLAVGACSAAAMRLSWLESELTGRRLNAGLANRVKPEHLDALAPIDDIRADAAYRRVAALTLVRRAIVALAKQKRN
ncbi:FAD binding domain-containing protein [Ferrovibrio xuzhouensis]|uniref:FAD binding domain-containing protein n=1 Tax=Ferrovibrio xuzhouensis TaxID=1576914 RepID=A0ABV7VJE9_9PROT